MASQNAGEENGQWFVMRDFTQTTTTFSYEQYEKDGFKVFVPLAWRMVGRMAHRKRVYAPFIRDLFFVYSTRKLLDPVVRDDLNVTYRYVKGGYHTPMIVGKEEMERFIFAVEHAKSVVYYKLSEITPDLCGKRIRIIGGKLDGYEGRLMELRTGKKQVQRLLVELPGFFAVGVEVAPKYIKVIDGQGE